MRKLVFAAALSVLATGAAAQVVGTADSVAQALADYGLRVEHDTDSRGAPKLTSRIEGTRFTIWFYGCDDMPCGSVQLAAGFNVDEPLPPSKLNQWNREKRFARGTVDDGGDPFLRMDIALSDGGVSPESFEFSLDMWRIALGQFRTFIGW